MKIILGADHRGFAAKEELKKHLLAEGYDVDDKGAFVLNPEDDYPDFAYPVALEVAKNPENTRGILLCGSGMGMDVVANKVKGIRATITYCRDSAAHARANDDVNIITLAADAVTVAEAQEITDVFLKTEFTGETRHQRRLEKISEIEKKNFL